MRKSNRKGLLSSHTKSSALVVSILLHAAFIAAALIIMAVTVVNTPEIHFEAGPVRQQEPLPPPIKQVPVKEQNRTLMPKLNNVISARPRDPEVHLSIPDMQSVSAPIGYGGDDHLGLPDFSKTPFGTDRGTGNEFIGAFYDLKQTPEGEPTEIGRAAARNAFDRATQLLACDVIQRFIASGWNERRLEDYFTAPKVKYLPVFMMPPMSASTAPEAFGVGDQVKSSYWICHYKGTIAAPETGRYRFCGICDDILVVRVGRRIVLDACWPELIGQVTSWESRDSNNRRFSLNSYRYGSLPSRNLAAFFDAIEKAGGMDGEAVWGNVIRNVQVDGQRLPMDNQGYMAISSRMVIGDWIALKKGQAVDVDILIGEIPGGEFNCRLLIEQEGVDYTTVASDTGPRPLLPIFKTVPIDPPEAALLELDPNEMTLEGPVFGVLINSNQPE